MYKTHQKHNSELSLLVPNSWRGEGILRGLSRNKREIGSLAIKTKQHKTAQNDTNHYKTVPRWRGCPQDGGGTLAIYTLQNNTEQHKMIQNTTKNTSIALHTKEGKMINSEACLSLGVVGSRGVMEKQHRTTQNDTNHYKKHLNSPPYEGGDNDKQRSLFVIGGGWLARDNGKTTQNNTK